MPEANRPPDPWDGVDWCKDDLCPNEDLHKAHPIATTVGAGRGLGRGRPPKHCPQCLKPLVRGDGVWCRKCGWRRGAAPEEDNEPWLREAKLPTGVWIKCLGCEGTGSVAPADEAGTPTPAKRCEYCNGSGQVTRTQALAARRSAARRRARRAARGR